VPLTSIITSRTNPGWIRVDVRETKEVADRGTADNLGHRRADAAIRFGHDNKADQRCRVPVLQLIQSFRALNRPGTKTEDFVYLQKQFVSSHLKVPSKFKWE